MDEPLLAELFQAAREGEPEALGQLLDACRFPLLFAANQDLPRRLRVKVAASDLVQETFLEARRDFGQFHGSTREELLTWLRRLLRHNVIDVSRRFYQSDKRALDQEVPLNRGISSATDAAGQVAADQASPSALAVAQEEAELVERGLQRVPDDYRQVILLRNREDLPFAEIGQKMGRSAEAARKLWAAAVERLQAELERIDE